MYSRTGEERESMKNRDQKEGWGEESLALRGRSTTIRHTDLPQCFPDSHLVVIENR